MKKVLIVHFGMHRAQSTSLQHGLHHLNEISDRHFFYPKSSTGLLLNDKHHTPILQDGRLAVDCCSRLMQKHAACFPEIPMVLSSEEFWRISPEAFKNIFVGYDIWPFSIRRRMAGWILSIWRHICTVEKISYTPREFLTGALKNIRNCRKTGDISFYDVEGRLGVWKSVYGEKLSVLEFERGEIFKNFFHVNNMDVPEKWRSLEVNLNSSHSTDEIIIKSRGSDTELCRTNFPLGETFRFLKSIEELSAEELTDKEIDELKDHLGLEFLNRTI